MNELRISLVQTDIIWEDKERNLKRCENLLQSCSGKSDLVVLPEMFSTGFSTHASFLAENNDGTTICTVRQWAKKYHLAICGSFMAKEQSGRIYNRGFFVEPAGNEWFYDKRHLFRLGGEHQQFTAGNRRVVVPYGGWNIQLIICYDLRFPVWLRNRKNDYDLIICPANWPAARADAWQTLLVARAMENQCYVCGVNRIGKDGNSIKHQGDSVLIDFKGRPLVEAGSDSESVMTAVIKKDRLDDFRNRFPVWMDADDFEILHPEVNTGRAIVF